MGKHGGAAGNKTAWASGLPVVPPAAVAVLQHPLQRPSVPADNSQEQQTKMIESNNRYRRVMLLRIGISVGRRTRANTADRRPEAHSINMDGHSGLTVGEDTVLRRIHRVVLSRRGSARAKRPPVLSRMSHELRRAREVFFCPVNLRHLLLVLLLVIGDRA